MSVSPLPYSLIYGIDEDLIIVVGGLSPSPTTSILD